MKKQLKAGLVGLLFFISPLCGFSQNEVGDLFKSGPSDAQKLLNAYLNPLFKGLGTGLNSGWSNTAVAKKPLRFDLRITGTAAFVPKQDLAFDVNTLNLENIRPVDPNRSVSPTAFGAKNEGPEMEIYNSSLPDPNPTRFKLPKGVGLKYVPSPQVQLTVGLLKHVDVSLRYVPEVKIEDGNLNLLGLGAKIELIPILLGKSDKIVPFDLAISGGFTDLKFDLPLDLENQPTHDQIVKLQMKGYSLDAMISKKIALLTVFGSIGYHESKTSVNALGTYEFDVPVTPTTPLGKQTYVDPFAFTQKDISGLKASAGLQLNLAVLKIFASYTKAQYDFVNAGIGIGIGK